ncbi:hypothetical protein [Mycoplasma sp. 31_09]|uniref:hypothetical protein n=1 Tax=Mycoplasma sp. 31_09 TaxID=3401663 RepID=UPI003AAA54E3
MNSYRLLASIFEEIKNNKEKYYKLNSSNNFEDQIENLFKMRGFTKIPSDKNAKISTISEREQISIQEAMKKFSELKGKVTSKNGIEVLKNSFKNIRMDFIAQPFGSQNFPDFLIFCSDYIFSLEIKSNKNKNKVSTPLPMWNSNLPKARAIYIYIYIYWQ